MERPSTHLSKRVRVRRAGAWLGPVAVAFGALACASGPDLEGAPMPPEASVELVDVQHAREFRGLWVATVSNLDFPTSATLTREEQQAELLSLLDRMADLRMNAVVFQVRPEGDALYRSSIDPWSRVLTGRQGTDPGWDPLAFLVDEAHARNIEVHAWFNPYRAGSIGTARDLAHPHVSVVEPAHVHRYGDFLWMDPGAKSVQDRTVEVVLDVARRYDIDGVHFDDYFYPYPNGKPFPDDLTWTAYRSGGGTLDRDDWRRQNVASVVQRVSEGLAEVKPHVRFGISPFGIYRPGTPEGVRGLDQYAEIFADPVHWMEEGWVDYLAPQLYWPTTARAQGFEALLAWWGALAADRGHVFAGHALHRWGEGKSWSADEFRAQVALTRSVDGSRGQVWFRARDLLDRPDAQQLLRDEVYRGPALTPPVAAFADVPVSPPRVWSRGDGLHLHHDAMSTIRSFQLYRWQAGAWTLEQVIPAVRADAPLALPEGRWAVSAAGKHGVESQGVVVPIDGGS